MATQKNSKSSKSAPVKAKPSKGAAPKKPVAKAPVKAKTAAKPASIAKPKATAKKTTPPAKAKKAAPVAKKGTTSKAKPATKPAVKPAAKKVTAKPALKPKTAAAKAKSPVKPILKAKPKASKQIAKVTPKPAAKAAPKPTGKPQTKAKVASKPAPKAGIPVKSKVTPKVTSPTKVTLASKPVAQAKGKVAPKASGIVTGGSVSKPAAHAPVKPVLVPKKPEPKAIIPKPIPAPKPTVTVKPIAKPAPVASKVTDHGSKPSVSTHVPAAKITEPVKSREAAKSEFKPIAVPSAKPIVKMTEKKEHKSMTATSEEPQKSRYSDKDLAEFDLLIDQKLIVAREQLEFYLKQLEDMAENPDNKIKGLDDGLSTVESERVSSMASRQQKLIQHLENAKIRIKNKVYGICRETGKLISKERLRAVPHATLSIEAKQAQN